MTSRVSLLHSRIRGGRAAGALGMTLPKFSPKAKAAAAVLAAEGDPIP